MLTRQTEDAARNPAPSDTVLSLVIPTLNEAGNLERMVRALGCELRAAGHESFEIIVVDDNSSDGTGEIAERLAQEMPGILRAVRRTGKASLGTAAVAGWNLARGNVLGLMDADFQHPPALIPRLLDVIGNGADIAIGSRYTEGGRVAQDWNVLRKAISAFTTVMTRVLLGRALRNVRDPFSGCFAMRRDVIAGTRLHPEGFKVLMEVLAAGNYTKVEEVPYQFAARTAGQSKLRLRVAIDDFLLLLRLAWQTRTRHRET